MRLHPAGGKFDPSEEFCYFLATQPQRHLEAHRRLPGRGLHLYPYVLVAVNEIDSPQSLADVDQLADERKLLLDSGIYNLAVSHARRHGMSMDEALLLPPDEVEGFTELYDRYCTVLSKYADRLWGAIELDLGGAQVKPETRARIVADTGVQRIPVVHPRSDGWDYYDAVAGTHDRICVGNLVKTMGSDRVRLLHALSERSRRDHPGVWHHLLGVTPGYMTHSMPVYGSSDSSTWLTGVRWAESWHTNTMGRAAWKFGRDMWFTPGAGNSYMVDAVAFGTAHTLEQCVRDVRAQYESIPG